MYIRIEPLYAIVKCKWQLNFLFVRIFQIQISIAKVSNQYKIIQVKPFKESINAPIFLVKKKPKTFISIL